MENRKDVTVSLEKSWVEAIDDHLDYGDSRSQWIREAVRQRLVTEDIQPQGADLDPAES